MLSQWMRDYLSLYVYDIIDLIISLEYSLKKKQEVRLRDTPKQKQKDQKIQIKIGYVLRPKGRKMTSFN